MEVLREQCDQSDRANWATCALRWEWLPDNTTKHKVSETIYYHFTQLLLLINLCAAKSSLSYVSKWKGFQFLQKMY